MDYTTLAIEAALLLISVYAYMVYWKYKDFPPGPYGLPLLGYGPFVGAKPHIRFRNLSRKYGSIISVNLGGVQTVVANDWPSVREVLVKQGDTFSNRPFLYIFDLALQGKEKDLASSSGPAHKEMKRTTMHILKNLGMGRSAMENMIVEELDKLVAHMRTQDGQLVDMNSSLFTPMLNIIWGITAGTKVDYNDSEMKSFADAIHTAISQSNLGVLNIFPFLRFVAPKLTGYSEYANATRKIHDYVEKLVDEHFEDDNAGLQTDFMHVFVDEIRKRRNDSKDDQPPYCKSYLVGTAMDLFGAGSDTIGSILLWAFLQMACNPEVQKKVHQELDDRIAPDSHLPYSLKSTIPYTEATLCETQRYASNSFLAVPHCSSTDATLFAYKIPKGTSVMVNIWALHHDEEYWSDPEEFRPERFLDDEGRLKKHDQYIPFGAGPRGCPAESLVKMELILFFSCLMRRFSFEMDPNRSLSTSESPLEPDVGMTLKARCNSLVLKCR